MKNLQHYLDTFSDEAKAVIAFMDANRWADPVYIARALPPKEFERLAEVTARVISRLRISA